MPALRLLSSIITPSHWRLWTLALLALLAAAGGLFIALDFSSRREALRGEARLQAAVATGPLLAYVTATKESAEGLAQGWVAGREGTPGAAQGETVAADPLL